MNTDLISITDAAQKLFGKVDRTAYRKIQRLISSRRISEYSDPLDARRKLVSLSELKSALRPTLQVRGTE